MSGIARKDWYETLTEEQQNMSIGTIVTSKRTGFPTIGAIMVLYEPSAYLAKRQTTKEDYPNWNNLYPDWFKKILVQVLFKEPQKPCTFEEFKNNNCNINKDDLWFKTHYEDIPLVKGAVYPIDDLELYEKENI